jgi:hypothetical protein
MHAVRGARNPLSDRPAGQVNRLRVGLKSFRVKSAMSVSVQTRSRCLYKQFLVLAPVMQFCGYFILLVFFLIIFFLVAFNRDLPPFPPGFRFPPPQRCLRSNIEFILLTPFRQVFPQGEEIYRKKLKAGTRLKT